MGREAAGIEAAGGQKFALIGDHPRSTAVFTLPEKGEAAVITIGGCGC